MTIVNTFTPEDLTIPVQKVWMGGSVDERPEAVEVSLYNGDDIANDKEGDPLTLSLGKGDQWTGEFKNVPAVDADLNPITYTVKEVEVPGFDVSYEGDQTRGFRVINTFSQGIKDITVTKKWIGGTERPEIELQLIRNNVSMGEDYKVTLNGSIDEDEWTYTWEKLPVNDFTGTSYVYTVQEVEVPDNYIAEHDGLTVTNTYVKGERDITAIKKWVGGPIEKPKVEITLFRQIEGRDIEQVPEDIQSGIQNPIELANGEISYTWNDLPQLDDSGNAYTYSVKETKIGEEGVIESVDVETGETIISAGDYKVSYAGNIITNTYKTDDITIEAEKIWVGGVEEGHTAPKFVLYQNGKALDTIPTVTPDTGIATKFIYKWTVPKTDEFGQEYTYTVDEVDTPAGYGKSVEVLDGKTIITNTFGAKVTDISVHKDWVGGSAPYPNITFELQRRVGTTGEFETVAKEVLQTGNHIHIWKNEPLQDDKGVDYEYRVVETFIGDTEVIDNKALTYTVSYSGDVANGFTVTNTSDNQHEIEITKVWVDDNNAGGTRPAQITFTAVRDDGVEKSQVFNVTTENIYRITGLEKFKPNSEDEYSYTISEVKVTGYDTAVEGTTVTNTLSNVKDVSFNKVWVGGPLNKPNITVELKANGESAIDVDDLEVEPIVLDNNQTTGVFKNLPAYNALGVVINYTVIETKIGDDLVEDGKAGNYTVANEGLVITNTYATEDIVIEAEKIWVGGPIADHIAPEFVLYQNGKALDVEPVVTPDTGTETSFTYEWTVPKTDAFGQDYFYAVDEEIIPEGYGKSINVDLTGKTIITNTFASEVTDIAVHKDWVGSSSPYPRIEIELQRRVGTDDYVTIGNSVTLENGNHIHIWRDQPLLSGDGVAYEYRVIETKIGDDEVTNVDEWPLVSGTSKVFNVRYHGTVENGFTITNSSTTANYEFEKRWIGGPIEKPNITVELKANGEEAVDIDGDKVEPIVLENGNTRGIFTNLPENDLDGNKITYSVEETQIGTETVVDDKTREYTVSYLGNVITNTYVSSKDMISVEKIWVGGDAENRPEVRLQLYRNGIAFGNSVPWTNQIIEWTNLDSTDAFGQAYNYSVDEVDVPEGYTKSIEVVGNHTKITNTFSQTLNDGDLAFRKVDASTNRPLGGAEFTLKSVVDGSIVARISSDANGVVNFGTQREGMYIVTETRVPNGYINQNLSFVAEITNDGSLKINGERLTGDYVVTNTPDRTPSGGESGYSAILIKHNEDKTILSNATFELYNERTNRLIGTYSTSGLEPIVVENLEAGSYYFKETVAPLGHEIRGAGIHKFSLPELDITPNTAVILATNYQIGGPLIPRDPDISGMFGTSIIEKEVFVQPDYDKVKVHMAYIFGYPEGTVMPDGNMTRAEAAAMIARLKGYPLADSSQPKFTDTPSGWYNSVINAVVKAGVMKGYPDGSFKPQNPITRAEFAQMLMPIDIAKSGVAPFEDIKGHWAEKAIDQAYSNGRILGYPDGTFKPNNFITRAEAATILNRMFDRKVTEEGLTDVKNEIHKFTDLTKDHWGYYEIVEASNSHVYIRIRSGELDEKWIEMIYVYGQGQWKVNN